MTDIVLPVIVDDERRSTEVIPAEPLGGGRFRLAASPGMVEGLAAGDEIELDDAEMVGYRLVKRSRNLCVWFYFTEPVDETHPAVVDVAGSVEAIGGWLDGGYSRMVVFTIPMAAGFPQIAHVFDLAAARHPQSTWYYGNVYDPKDGATPLGWWLAP